MAQKTDINHFENRELPEWVNWLAQDADGTWWGFEVEPHPHHQGWYENEIGRWLRLQKEAANPDWSLTLTRLAALSASKSHPKSDR